METEITIINNRKKQEYCDFQQCRSDEIIEVSDSPSPVHLQIVNCPSSDGISKKNEATESNFTYTTNFQEEPIDLTFGRSNFKGRFETENVRASNPKRIIIQPKQKSDVGKAEARFPLYEKGIKRNVDTLNSVNSELLASNWNQMPNNSLRKPYLLPEIQPSQNQSAYSYAIVRAQQPDLSGQLTTRQQEVLKMAKSIFSKRTRTLYHWMYPTASKQQIKQVVSSTWESMAAQEKNIYIAQVLGRFGCSNANLMVNPQLEQIKELPPMPGIQEFNPKASELQNAISSISNETDTIKACGPVDCCPDAFSLLPDSHPCPTQTNKLFTQLAPNPLKGQYLRILIPCYSNNQPRKKPRVSKVVQNVPTACQEFDDDPELSQELAQFSIMLNNQF